jgi:hypothetical protein
MKHTWKSNVAGVLGELGYFIDRVDTPEAGPNNTQDLFSR